MKITKIELFPLTITYKRKTPFSMGGMIRSASNTVLIKIHTDEGIIGIGEHGNATTWYIGETQDSVMGAITSIFGSQVLIGEDPFNIEKIMAKMDRAARYNNFSKAIIDYALHDIMGKALGVPVYKLLGGKTIDKIPLGFVLSYGTNEEVAEEASEALSHGFKFLKLKVAQENMENDIALVRGLRESVGPNVKIGIDCNGAWHYYQALQTLDKLQKYDLFMVEQPLPWWDIDGMARLRKKIGIPLITDESLVDLNTAMQIIQKEAADGLFIKVSKLGGLLMAQKVVAVAKAAGLAVYCGCLIGSGLESAIQAHFLISDEWMSKLEQENLGPLHVHDVWDTVNNKITDDLAKNMPRYENGYLYVPEGPGLGVELNEAMIPKLMTPGKKPVIIER
jgi:L-alanine-DL-glutamate epimerase-like enolase superfamily enzyme